MFGLAIEIFITILLMFLSKDWIVEAFRLDNASFLMWSSAMLCAGASLGWSTCLLISKFRTPQSKVQAQVEAYKAAADKAERDCAVQIQQMEHKIGELTTQLEAEKTRAASVDEIERKYSKAQERIAELEAADESSSTEKDKESRRRKAVLYARNLALGLSHDDKSFLLALEKHGCIQFEGVSMWDISSELSAVEELVEHTEVACNVHRVWLNERGEFVLREARDILEMLVSDDTDEDMWWSYGTFV